MTLAELREQVWTYLDWSPSQAESAKARANTLINAALEKMTTEASWLLPDIDLTLDVPKDIVLEGDNLLNVVSTDPWVLSTGDIPLIIQDPWPASTETALAGRRISLRYNEEKWFDFRIRDSWDSAVGMLERQVRFSLDRPWPNTTDEDIKAKIWTSEVMLPPQVKQIKAAWWREEDHARTLELRAQFQYENIHHVLPEVDTSGVPTVLYDRPGQSLASPKYTPQLNEEGASGTWNGTESSGKFQYCITYSIGRQDHWRIQGSPHAQAASAHSSSRLSPFIESGPSKPSDVIDNGQLLPGHIKITLPDINAREGFGGGATVRYNHCGILINIYRRRIESFPVATNFVNEASDKFYFMATATAGAASWTDTGLIVPDYSRPLPEAATSRAVQVWPVPEEMGELHLRCTMNPAKLVDDEDSPMIIQAAHRALVHLAVAEQLKTTGNTQGAEMHLTDYRRVLDQVKGLVSSVHVEPRTLKGYVPLRRYTNWR